MLPFRGKMGFRDRDAGDGKTALHEQEQELMFHGTLSVIINS